MRILVVVEGLIEERSATPHFGEWTFIGGNVEIEVADVRIDACNRFRKEEVDELVVCEVDKWIRQSDHLSSESLNLRYVFGSTDPSGHSGFISLEAEAVI